MLYGVVETRSDATVMKLQLSWSADSAATTGTFAWSGDALQWTISGITRPNNSAWLVCANQVVYVNLGNYGYQVGGAFTSGAGLIIRLNRPLLDARIRPFTTIMGQPPTPNEMENMYKYRFPRKLDTKAKKMQKMLQDIIIAMDREREQNKRVSQSRHDKRSDA